MNKLIYILMGIAVAILFSSCGQEELDHSKSIFDTSSEVKSEFDKWLNNNYVETYNIDYKYRLEDIESDFSKNFDARRSSAKHASCKNHKAMSGWNPMWRWRV